MSEREARGSQVDGIIRRYDEFSERRLMRRLLRAVWWLARGTLWGHGVRSLVGNPIFALLPWYFLERYAASSASLVSWLWLCAFVLGYPHALYTTLEIRHLVEARKESAGRRTLGQLACFGGHGLLGGVLAVWYVAHGAVVLAERLGQEVHAMVVVLAVGASVGAVVGLQDVLVMHVLLRPGRVLRASVRALTSPRHLALTTPTAITQFLLAEFVLPLV